MKRLTLSLALMSLLLGACTIQSPRNPSDENLVVNVYSARHYDLDQSMFDEFTALTGITVNVVNARAEELLERMEREASAPEADLFMTVGAEHIYRALSSNLLDVLTPSAAYEFIDPEFYGQRWVALSKRARIIAYDPEKTTRLPQRYQDLANPEYAGTVLVRTSSNFYNIALVADFIDRFGEAATRTWLSGLVANFARTPSGNDRDQAKAVLAGLGEYGIMNTYYLGLMLNSSDPEEVKVAERIAIHFPLETHLNLSWAGRVVNGPNPVAAQKLIDFLLEIKQQSRFSLEGGEYPARNDAELNPIIKTWPELKPAKIDYEQLGANVVKAVQLMDEAGWQ
jgi:iron(III) transport system substrate-binding protein